MTDEVKKLVGFGGKGGGGSSGMSEDPNTLTNNTIAKGIVLISEGPVEGLSTGDGKSIYLNDVPLVDSSGELNFKGVAWTFRNGLPDQDVITGMDSPSNVIPVSAKVFEGIPIIQTIEGDYSAVYVTISIPALTSTDSKTGALHGTDLEYAIEVKTATGSWVTAYTEQLVNQKTTSEWQKSYRVDLPTGGSPWQVRVRRITPDSTTVTVTNDLYFATLTLIVAGSYNYRNSSILGMQFVANDFKQQVPSIKVKLKGVKVWVPQNYDPIARTYADTGPGTSGGVWDGTFKAAWTNNPVWIFHDLIVNNRYGLGQDFNPTDDPETAFVDKWALYNIGQFCDEMIDDGFGGTEPRYTINTQITDKQEAYELLQSIISTINGMLYFSAGEIAAVTDRPEGLADMYTQADVENGLFEYSGTALKTRHSAVVAYWNDPQNLYKRTSIVYEDPELIEKFGYRKAEINLFGCTSRGQAHRAAKWLLHTEKTQTQTVTFRTGQRGGFLRPGDVIKIFDDYKAGRRQGGRIMFYDVDGSGNCINFAPDFAQAHAAGDTILYQNTDGDIVTCTATADLGDGVFRFTGGVGVPVLGGTWALIQPDLDGQLYRVLSVIEEDLEKYTVIALEHDESKYAIIDAVPAFDQGPTSIYTTDVLPPPTNLHITTWWENLDGAQSDGRLTASWTPPNNIAVTQFELQLKTPIEDWNTVAVTSKVSWDSPKLFIDTFDGYTARVRSLDNLGRKSAWCYSDNFSVPGKVLDPEPPSNVSIVEILNGYKLTWTNPDITDYAYTEIVHSAQNNINTAIQVSAAKGTTYTYHGLRYGETRYVWLRTTTFAATHNVSSWTGPYRVTAGGTGDTSIVRTIEVLVTDPNGQQITNYTGAAYVFIPTTIDGMQLYDVDAKVVTPSSSGDITIDIVKDGLGGSDTSLLTSLLTIDAGTYGSTGSTTPPVISEISSNVKTDDLIRIDITNGGTGAEGLMVAMTFGPGYSSSVPASVLCDPYYTSTVLLLKGEGTEGGLSFLDNSAASRTPVIHGGVHTTTSNFRFGSSSIYFDGAGDGLEYANSSDFDFGTSDFTIECWIKLDAGNDGIAKTIISKYNTGDMSFYLDINETNWMRFGYSTDGTTIVEEVYSAYPFVSGVWYHIAVDRAGGWIRNYVNGAMIAKSATASTPIHTSTTNVFVGFNSLAGWNPFIGWMDELRVTKGIARFGSDSGFSPPEYTYPVVACE